MALHQGGRNGLLEVDVTETDTGKAVTGLFQGTGTQMTPEQVEKARADMQRLKFHPRDALPNATALARAEALFAELTGPARHELGAVILEFQTALAQQDPRPIATLREILVASTTRLGG